MCDLCMNLLLSSRRAKIYRVEGYTSTFWLYFITFSYHLTKYYNGNLCFQNALRVYNTKRPQK